ncbi:MAG: hypothetical protein HC836_23305 [Richelia sp. RM2_1_2]|nr:hypothetical protein [Richelia sp. RM2_1_2]
MNKFVISTLMSAMTLVASASYAGPPTSPVDINPLDLTLGASNPGLGDFSRGKRVGFLNKVSVKGWPASTEGELMVGNESSYLETTVSCGTDGKNRCTKVINPWGFSAAKERAPEIREHEGTYVVIEYLQASVKSLSRSTDYELVRIYPIDRSAAPAEACVREGANVGTFSDGSRTGRVVKMSNKGNLFKSNEIIVQEGFSGNKFHPMSITDGDSKFVRCVHNFMISGKPVKVQYSQSWLRNPSARDTSYEVISVTPVAKSSMDD